MAEIDLLSTLRRLRPIFHWQFTGVTVPLFWGTALAMIGIALAATNEDAVRTLFVLAYVFFVAAGVYTVGCWFASDSRAALFRDYSRFRREKRKRKAYVRFQKWNTSVLLFVFLLFSVSIYLTRRLDIATKLSTFEDTLEPANDPIVQACGGAFGEEAIFFTGTIALKIKRWPQTILKVKGIDRIVAGRNEDGLISISAQIFSTDGRIVTNVFRNAFKINKNNIFTMERPDVSTLRVIDQNGEVALYMRYMNKSELRFDAKLYYRDYGQVDFNSRVQNLCIDLNSQVGAIFAFD